jgi:hypothetical protein
MSFFLKRPLWKVDEHTVVIQSSTGAATRFFQIAPKLHERRWIEHVITKLLYRRRGNQFSLHNTSLHHISTAQAFQQRVLLLLAHCRPGRLIVRGTAQCFPCVPK